MGRWYLSSAPMDDIAVSSRIRLARNLKDIPFPSLMTKEQRIELNNKVKKAVCESYSQAAVIL